MGIKASQRNLIGWLEITKCLKFESVNVIVNELVQRSTCQRMI